MVEKYTCIKIIETVVEESVEIITSIAHASCSVFLTSSFVRVIKDENILATMHFVQNLFSLDPFHQIGRMT